MDGSPQRGDAPSRSRTTRRRTTIAFLADTITHHSGAYEAQFRTRLAEQCRALDINLLLVYGGAIQHPMTAIAAQNGIFELMHPDSVDGLVVLSTALSSYCGPERVRELVARRHALPCCSIGLALEGVPSVVVDNEASMEAIVEHLVVVHGRRRIAFLGGTPDNPEAQARHAAYGRVLLRHGLPVDPALFAHGYFWSRPAIVGLQEILARNVEFDALVCANDAMAQVVRAVLAERGLRMPRDIAVTGFDDVLAAKMMSPPLTTAAQPFEAMVERAVQLVLDQIAGRAVPLVTELKAPLVIRQSCGCGRETRRFTSPDSLALEMRALNHLHEATERIESELRRELCLVPGCEADGAERMMRALEAELFGQSGDFVERIEAIVGGAILNPEQFSALHRSVACLRAALRAFSSVSLEDLWHQARDCIDFATARGQLEHSVRLNDEYVRLHECNEEVTRALNQDSLRTSLSKILPLMRIQSGAISKYIEGGTENLELVAALLDETLQNDSAARFPARHLLPPNTYADGRRHTSLVLPLMQESQQLGVAVFEYSGDALGHLMVRTQISAALNSIHLHQEIIEKSMQHERGLQERMATTKRLDALSVLAGGVAHDLNNALGPLVALPDVILGDLDATIGGGDSSELRRDIETVKSAALRAAQTIKDLLTLGRQGRTAKEPLDLVQVIKTCLSSELRRIVRGVNPLVQLRIEVPDDALVIHASEGHIVRAITNLVHNAAEAITGDGEVLVRVYAVHLAAPMNGFESVEPGMYAVLSVSDNGNGIQTQDLHRIFEPFFSRKRMVDHSGSGLGLAIVHGVIKEHDGYIDVASTPGAGTTFSLYIPRAELRMSTVAPRLAPPTRGKGRILIVDDEPVQLRTGRRVLNRFGYQVDTLESGRLALERFHKAADLGASPYDLVILDMILNEDADGLECFEQIRELFPAQRAIVVSGHAPTERAEAAFEKGLAWLAKPYTADALAQAVQAGLAEHQGVACQRISSKPSRAPSASD